ncbi:MAG: zinc ribbon domain-containing protein [Deltaproteobacteria bacterium]
MPIYEFECARCKQLFERFLFSHNDAGGVQCPRCGGEGIKKPSAFSSCGRGSTGGGPSVGSSSCGTGGFSRRFG